MIIPELLRKSPLRKNPEIDRLARLLLPPLVPNHQPGHPSLSSIWARELEESAKPYIFDATNLDAALALAGDQNSYERLNVLATCRAPSRKCYFEFEQFPGETIGIITEGDRDDVVISVIGSDGSEIIPFYGIKTQFDSNVARVRLFGDFDQEKTKQYRTYFVLIVTCFWAFIGTPGVAKVSQVITREGREAQRRGRFTLSALHSYNKVTLNIPRDHRTSNTVHFKRGPGVRYHDVVGHKRLRKRPPPGSSKLLRWLYAWWYGEIWIEPYPRGDKLLGTVVKERHVRAA